MSTVATLRPLLVVPSAAAAIDYYVQALGARETGRRTEPDGRISGAELAIGNAQVTVRDAGDASPAVLLLEVDDVPAAAGRMAAAGGTVRTPPGSGPGEPTARVEDPFGHNWLLTRQAAGPRAGQPEEDLGRFTDLQTPWCVHTVATLGIAQQMAAGRSAVGDLAAAAGVDRDALHSVLAYLAGQGIFEQAAPGHFQLNTRARQLLLPGQFLDLAGIGGRMARSWATLPDYVRTGRPAYADVFGLPFWADLAAHPDVAASFDALMGLAGHGRPDPGPPLSGGWEQVRTVVDVGGGTGAMLAEILRVRPWMHGTLVDLPGTVARAGDTFAQAGVAGRVTLAGQSFFDPLPAGADLYLLKKVLNDWPDAETVAILRRCAEAASPAGRVLVLGGVAPDEAPPVLAIDMLVAGGKTSSLAEFRELARQAGLLIGAVTGQPSGSLVVECRPG
jgi:2,7-dihydroxy-5-methyl-1-naphthoate 7-O-methyltransferase